MSPEEEAAYQRGVSETLGLIGTVLTVSPSAVSLIPQDARSFDLDELEARLRRADPQALSILRPYDSREALSTKQAAGVAGVSESTIRAWIDRYCIGRHRVNTLLVSNVALAMLLDGRALSLAALLSGDRTGPLVAPYIERAGIS